MPANKLHFKNPITGMMDSVQVDYSQPVIVEVATDTTETNFKISAPSGDSEAVEHIGPEPKPKH